MWSKLFQALWKTFQIEFDGILRDMAAHKQLIESQVAVTNLKESLKTQLLVQATLDGQRQEEKLRSEEEKCRRRGYVYKWLAAANFEADQEAHLSIRQAYPGTGKWLLKDPRFSSWFNSLSCDTHLLWLTGIPGAGRLSRISRYAKLIFCR